MDGRILITGGAGFIGTNLIEHALSNTNLKFLVLDNESVGRFEDLKKIAGFDEGRVELFKGDIRSMEDVEEAIDGCSIVVNLAAQTGVVPSIEDPRKDALVNIMGTLNLLEASRKFGIKRFVQASSAAPLGEQDPPLHEGKLPGPLSPYGASKLACEGYCSAYRGSFGLSTVVLRFSNVYGRHSFKKGSVIAKFIKEGLSKRPLTIFGDGGQTRDFVYAGDLSQGILNVIFTTPQHSIYQLGTGVETSVNQLVGILKDEFRKRELPELNVEHGPRLQGEIMRNYTDISLAMRELDYHPKMELKAGVGTTIEWFLNNRGNL
ncbi:MAG: NAD-dependent epimerase/dehydratase family protein [Thermoplasmatota archaeon]